MNNTVFIDGQAAITTDETNRVISLQFMSNDEHAPILEQSSQSSGQLMMLRNASFDYVANKPRVRASSQLIRKAAHGRLSATKDGAIQLTLKIFRREGLDVTETMKREAFELLSSTKL